MSFEQFTYKQLTCPCCGYITFEAIEPGTNEICQVCGWEDDLYGLIFPLDQYCGGYPSLADAQKNYERYGNCSGDPKRASKLEAHYERGPSWHPLKDEEIKFLPRERDTPIKAFPDDLTVFYYWKETYLFKKR